MTTNASVLDRYPDYQVDIGIEVHVQLNTKSKIFCASQNGPTEQANTNIDPVCTGYPGSLPVLNKQVVLDAITTGLATNCTINLWSEFARKHYFYPDLPKGYQVTQDQFPICSNGLVAIRLEDGALKNIRLQRIHMEEDAGKNIHAPQAGVSLVDLNRAGSPLLEIVSHPDIKSSYEARAYLKMLHSIVTYIGVCSGNMEEGVFRADTNISVRKKDAEELGTRCELKNINSFKFISDAIEYEIERQILLIESGQKIIRETRLWDTKEQKTFSMRSKEDAADYRYVKDPDLPPVCIDPQWIENAKNNLPELPIAKFNRLIDQYKLTSDEAEILVNDPNLASYFEDAARLNRSKLLINWILRDLLGHLKDKKIALHDCLVTPNKLANLIKLLEQGTINSRGAQEIFIAMSENGKDPETLVKELNLTQLDNPDELRVILTEIIEKNPQQVAGYKAGKSKLWGFFVGQAMTKTQGRANPQQLNTILEELLQN